MSLRTKLLAVVVGLPGAILMLALLLFVRSEPSTPKSAIDRLVHLAAGGTTDPIGQGILRLEEQGHFAHIYVVRLAKSGDAENHPADAWTAKAYYAPNRGEADVTDPALLALLVSQLREASGPSPPFTLREDYVAVGFKPKKDVRASGIVAFLRSPLSDAKTVYWVIVTGLTVMMVFSYWMISRLVIGPLARLAVAADRIAEGDFGVDVAGKEAGDEVGRTIRALNRMAREIAEYQGQLEDRVLTALERIKKAEQHLTIAQRLAATGKLASGLAHEINNPLGGMKNAVRALSRGDLSAERTTLYLDLITDGLSRVEQTVKKFLTFTPRAIEPHPVDLVVATQKGMALAMHRLGKKHIELTSSFPEPGTAIVFGDPHELQQVALNLLLNAADAIDAKAAGRVEVAIERRGDEVVLSVKDDGHGMSPEDQGRCFDIFYTTKPVGEGTGMGLAVVHTIVTNHGGRIEVTSAVGEGASFHVFLPAEPAVDPAEPAGAHSPGAAPEA